MEENRHGSPAAGQAALSKRRWWILATVSVGTFMATLDGSIANVALPSIARDTHTSMGDVQWVLNAYLLTICALLPIVGKISDMVGRTRIYNYGFLIFTLGSLWCGLSHSLTGLILARIVQAIGAACMMANNQAIVSVTFASGGRGRAMGITGAMVSIGSLTGPGIGGILIGHFGWPAIFFVNIPIGIIGFIAGWFILPRSKRNSQQEPFDYTGSVFFMIGMVAFLYTASKGEEWGWGSNRTLSLGLLAIIFLIAFFIWERKTRFPMLDFSLYRIRAFRIGNITALLSFVALFCSNVMMPFYLQNILGFSPEKTGYAMMVYPMVMAVVAPFAGWLSDKIGSSYLTTGGLLLNAIGFALLNTLSMKESMWVVALHLAIFGLGHGFFQSPNNSSVMGAVPRPQLGTAGGLNALVRNVGMVLGVSFSVTLLTFRMNQLSGHSGQVSAHESDPALMMQALHTVFWAAFAICLVGVMLSSLRLKKQPQSSD